MEVRFSVAYANIVTANIERTALSSHPDIPTLYLRYIDDTLIIWPYSQKSLSRFVINMNSQAPNILAVAQSSPVSRFFGHYHFQIIPPP